MAGWLAGWLPIINSTVLGLLFFYGPVRLGLAITMTWPDFALARASGFGFGFDLGSLRSTNSWENGASKYFFLVFLWFAAEVMRAALHLPSPIPTLWTVVVFLPAIENQFLVSPIVSQPKIKFLSSCPTGAGIFLFVSLVRTFFYFIFF